MVGQDLVKLEPGGPSESGKKEEAASELKEPVSSDQPTPSDLGLSKKDISEWDNSAPPPPIEEKKAALKAAKQPKEESPRPKQADRKKSKPKSSSSVLLLGN